MTTKQEIFTSEFLEIFGKLKELVEKYVSDIQTEKLEEAVETFYSTEDISMPKEAITERESEEVIDIIEKDIEVTSITATLMDVISQINVSNRKDEIIENMHKELMQYKTGLKEALITPLLKAIVREYDRANNQYRFYYEKSQTEPQSDLFKKLLSEFELLSFSLLNLLSDYDIEPFVFNAGEARDNKLQKIVEVIETEDPQQDGTVLECVTCGFRNIDTTRLFRQAEVKVYKKLTKINNNLS